MINPTRPYLSFQSFHPVPPPPGRNSSKKQSKIADPPFTLKRRKLSTWGFRPSLSLLPRKEREKKKDRKETNIPGVW